ncbi:hypothetical protein BIZ92_17360 [Achromobacter xylosoxidans]|uniref:Uncharacterized protein n=1 Tax=Alcaligenes xylosoxydans xylosoxydans TaxID=85698 RepID=A0A1R1JJV4_ALCXX|nr:hypothetical protein BIZ92_17360 [Achromobacter xylosoxidans]
MRIRLVFHQVSGVAQVDVPINEHPGSRCRLGVVQADIDADFLVLRMARAVDDDLFAVAREPCRLYFLHGDGAKRGSAIIPWWRP